MAKSIPVYSRYAIFFNELEKLFTSPHSMKRSKMPLYQLLRIILATNLLRFGGINGYFRISQKQLGLLSQHSVKQYTNLYTKGFSIKQTFRCPSEKSSPSVIGLK